MPKYLAERPWMIPICIVSLTLGLYLILSLLFPGFDPYLQERLAARGFSTLAFLLGSLCVTLPVLLLRICVESDIDDAADRDENDSDQ